MLKNLNNLDDETRKKPSTISSIASVERLIKMIPKDMNRLSKEIERNRREGNSLDFLNCLTETRTKLTFRFLVCSA